MTKYRILKVTDSDGVEIFYPQYRFVWWWCNFFSWDGGDLYFHSYELCDRYLTYKSVAKSEVMKEF